MTKGNMRPYLFFAAVFILLVGFILVGLIVAFAISFNSSGSPEFVCNEAQIQRWAQVEGKNRYGDSADTMYLGGTPLFNEATGQATEYCVYMLKKFPERPWRGR